MPGVRDGARGADDDAVAGAALATPDCRNTCHVKNSHDHDEGEHDLGHGHHEPVRVGTENGMTSLELISGAYGPRDLFGRTKRRTLRFLAMAMTGSTGSCHSRRPIGSRSA